MFAIKWHVDAGDEFVAAWFSGDIDLRRDLDAAMTRLEIDLATAHHWQQ